MSRILNPQFKYVSAANTDIRKTIARERRRIQEAQRQAEQLTNVAAIAKAPVKAAGGARR